MCGLVIPDNLESDAAWGQDGCCVQRMWDSIGKTSVAKAPAIAGNEFSACASTNSRTAASSTTRALAATSNRREHGSPHGRVMNVEERQSE